MMKLVVALKTASKPRNAQSGSAYSRRLNTGRPSMTVLSKRMRRPAAEAAAATSGQFQAMGPLLAVTTSMPRRNASRTWPVAAGVYDGAPAATPERSPITVSSTSTSAPEAARSSGAGRAACGGAGPSATAASTSAGAMPAGSSRLPCRVPAAVIRTRRPCRSASTRSWAASSSQRARATLPKPSRQSRTSRGRAASSPEPNSEMLTSRGVPAGVAGPAVIASSARGRRRPRRAVRARPGWCTERVPRARGRRDPPDRAARSAAGRRSPHPR